MLFTKNKTTDLNVITFIFSEPVKGISLQAFDGLVNYYVHLTVNQ